MFDNLIRDQDQWILFSIGKESNNKANKDSFIIKQMKMIETLEK